MSNVRFDLPTDAIPTAWFNALPRLVFPSAAISGLSTEFGRVTPMAVLPPYGHSVNGIGGVVCGAFDQSASVDGGALGSVGALSRPHSSR